MGVCVTWIYVSHEAQKLHLSDYPFSTFQCGYGWGYGCVWVCVYMHTQVSVCLTFPDLNHMLLQKSTGAYIISHG